MNADNKHASIINAVCCAIAKDSIKIEYDKQRYGPIRSMNTQAIFFFFENV